MDGHLALYTDPKYSLYHDNSIQKIEPKNSQGFDLSDKIIDSNRWYQVIQPLDLDS